MIYGASLLYLLVNPGGSRLWYLKYRIDVKKSHLDLAVYPNDPLLDARQLRDGIYQPIATRRPLFSRFTSGPTRSFVRRSLARLKPSRITRSHCDLCC
ncbi:Arm DNA-binding domain-containing protein [Lonsdalea quercina]|uniref:Arm DNA-binding domain-containing protein n=1 Tax=Lonsdalea quercina TaxID=71657 RepID=UPI003F527B96